MQVIVRMLLVLSLITRPSDIRETAKAVTFSMMELITVEDDGDLSESLPMLEPGDGLTTSSNIHKCNLK